MCRRTWQRRAHRLEVEILGKKVASEVVAMPLYDPEKRADESVESAIVNFEC
jgi:glycine cleavage system aminomethyltransferase T